MNLRALFHKRSAEHFPVPSDQSHPQSDALKVLQSRLFGDLPSPLYRQALSFRLPSYTTVARHHHFEITSGS